MNNFRQEQSDNIPTLVFLRRLTRAERTALRRSSVVDMEELREELASGVIDANDPVIRTLVAAIPTVTPERVFELLG